MQLFSRPDLYFKVSSGESFARTPTVHNSTHPTFDEPLLLFPNHPRGSTLPTGVAPLTIRVFDDDLSVLEKNGAVKTAVERFGMADIGDDYVGSATIELGKGWESMGTTEHKVRAARAVHAARARETAENLHLHMQSSLLQGVSRMMCVLRMLWSFAVTRMQFCLLKTQSPAVLRTV